ncbi:MAG: 2-phosphosulfolactate phosphatase [Candidatus Abyssobacteria bacterium SURF_17]|uniref:Probable 2-phosphosulfolactate phosphatase n=1 Tax=Candidatus Abyssobacteria bacterium SURF_17 TaxID=2093361 RepID=A0A419F8N4_9BACT|nr:MAG: 2-phosphosulfolactate phosphatase [Candidatus Abyssubacteria bacterium SURF_17]
MSRVRVALTVESVKPEHACGSLCVVIDVLRASTTIVTAIANGCPSVIPTETPEQAREIARGRNCLLGGERGGLRIEGFDLGNSPLEYVPEAVRNRPIAFTTTNGTRAIRACAAAHELVIASFLNGPAVIRLLEAEERDILIVCAGTLGSPSIEDSVCAGMLLESLHAGEDLATKEAISQWKEHRENLAGMMKFSSEHGRSLVMLGFERDIDFAAQQGLYDIIAVREDDSIVRKKA